MTEVASFRFTPTAEELYHVGHQTCNIIPRGAKEFLEGSFKILLTDNNKYVGGHSPSPCSVIAVASPFLSVEP